MPPTERKYQPFRFRDLPIEIQLEIFRLLKTDEPPRATTDAGRAKVLAWTKQAGPHRSGLFTRNTFWGWQARYFLLLNKSTYKDFAPHYYQSSAIRFLDPFTFANDFLANANDICIHNLRYVSFILNSKKYYPSHEALIEVMRKMAELIEACPELRTLRRFEFVYVFCFRTPVLHDRGSATFDMKCWNGIDANHRGALSEFQRRAMASTFEGFEVDRRVKFEEVRFGCLPEHLSITFSRKES